MKTNRLRRLAALGAMTLAAGASIATSTIPKSVSGVATSASFELTADHPVRTFAVTVDMNADASQNTLPGPRKLSLTAMLFATADGGAEVTATISPDGTQSTTAVLKGRNTETVSLDAAPAFFEGCQDGQACVRQGTVRFELRSGTGARGSFLAQAEAGAWNSDPPAGATIKVTIVEQTP